MTTAPRPSACGSSGSQDRATKARTSARDFALKTDADGRFDGERQRHRLVLHARSADRRLAGLAALRRESALDVGEPTKAVLLETPGQFRAVEVTIVEPADRV